MTTSKAHSVPGETKSAATLGRAEQRATIVGSLLGGAAGATVIYEAVAPLYLRYMALVLGIGPGSKTRGVVAFMVVAAVFGAAFGAFTARHAGTVARTLMGLAKTNGLTRRLFGPFFSRAPLTTTTTITGLLYGVVVGILVGRVLVPALVVGATPFTFELSRSDPGILAGFVAFGGVLGLTYGLTVEGSTGVRLGVGNVVGNNVRALFLGPLVGAAAGAAWLYVLVPGHLASLALIVGVRPTATGALGVWFVAAFLLSQVFVLTGARTVSRGPGYVSGCATAGFAYGLVLAVALGMVAVPHYVTELTEWTVGVPNANLGITTGYLLFGTFLGTAYGSAVRSGSVLPRVVREHRDAVVFSSLFGGFVGGSVIYQAAGHAQLLFYGSLVGYAGSVPRSWAVWLTTSLLLGTFYVRFVRPRDESVGYLWRSTRRGLLFGLAAGFVVGGMVVPAVVDATTRFAMPVPYLDPVVLVGYTLFGGIVGVGYGASFEEEGLAVGGEKTTAVAFGSLLGGVMGGLAIHHLAGPVYLQYIGALVGVEGSVAKSWAVWLLCSMAFGVVFARVVSRSINGYVNTALRLTASNPDLRAVLQPLMERAALTTTATGIGIGYGLVLGVVVGLLVIPLVVTTTTAFVFPYPSTNLGLLFGYLVYGAFLGAGYGVAIEF